MERQTQAHSALAAQAVAYIGEASRMMTIPNQLLMLWTGSAAPSDPELPAIAAELSSAASGVVVSVGLSLIHIFAEAQKNRAATASAIEGLKAQVTANQKLVSQVGGAVQRIEKRTEERVEKAVEQVAGEASATMTASLDASNARACLLYTSRCV